MGTLIGSRFLNQRAAVFNGVDEYVYKDGPAGFSTEGFISFLYRPTTVLAATGGRGILAFYDTSNIAILQIGLRRAPSIGNVSRIEILPRNNAVTNNYTSFAAITTTISAGVWYHVVIRCSAGAYAIWINGVSQTINPWFTDGSGSSPIWFGSMSAITSPRFAIGRSSASYSDCRLDEVVMGSAVITGTQVAGLASSSAVAFNPHRISGLGLTHWWRCGDSRDNASTIFDEIGSENLTLVNMDATNYVNP